MVNKVYWSKFLKPEEVPTIGEVTAAEAAKIVNRLLEENAVLHELVKDPLNRYVAPCKPYECLWCDDGVNNKHDYDCPWKAWKEKYAKND